MNSLDSFFADSIKLSIAELFVATEVALIPPPFFAILSYDSPLSLCTVPSELSPPKIK